jgi:hypothetical protein
MLARACRRVRKDRNVFALPASAPGEDLWSGALAPARRERQSPRLGRCGGLQQRESPTPPAWGPLTRTTLDVLKTLLWRFHGADGGGRGFPSYERIARVAKCCRDSVCVAIAALEEAGLLTWVHRITRIRRREQDLFGQWGSVCRSSALRTRTSFSIRWSASRGGAAMWHVKRKIRLDPRTQKKRKTERCRHRHQGRLGDLERQPLSSRRRDRVK